MQTDWSWKTGRPNLLPLARQRSVHFDDGNVILKEAETGWVPVVLSKNWAVGCQPAEVLVAQNLFGENRISF